MENNTNCADNAQIKNAQVIDNQGVKEPVAQIDDQFIGSSLLRYKKDQLYNCGDVETEGLNGIYTRPWQISYSIFTINKIIASYNQYIWWPDLNISDDAARVTRFDYNTYKSIAQPIEEVQAGFEKYYLDKNIIVVGHNWTGYDNMIWNVLRKAMGLKPIFSTNLRTIDTLALARAYRLGIKPPKFDPNNTENNHDFLSWQFRMLSVRQKKLKTGLSAIAKDLNIIIDESKLHSADYDISLNQEVFKSLIWKMEI